MSEARFAFTVFTKPWKALSLLELGQYIKGLGFDGVELPVRPGFQVEPEHVARDLPEARKILADCGVKIGTVAGPTDEPTIAACGACGVPIIRICCDLPADKDYLAGVSDWQRRWDALIPLLERHGVALGVQNHCDRSLNSAMALRHAIERYDPRHVCAVLDAAHTSLQGESPDLALDIVWSHLRVMNLKSAFWQRMNEPEAPQAEWRHQFTTARHGRSEWPRYAAELKRRGFRGDLCLTAEYDDGANVDRYIAEDLAYAKALFA